MILPVIIFSLGVAAVIILPLTLPKIIRPRQRVPGWDTRMDSCPYDPVAVSEALLLFAKECELKWPTERKRIRYGIDHTNIYWRDVEYFIASDGKTKAAGELKKRGSIVVACKDREIYQTAIFHELYHSTLMWLNKPYEDDDFSEHDHELVESCKKKLKEILSK